MPPERKILSVAWIYLGRRDGSDRIYYLWDGGPGDKPTFSTDFGLDLVIGGRYRLSLSLPESDIGKSPLFADRKVIAKGTEFLGVIDDLARIRGCTIEDLKAQHAQEIRDLKARHEVALVVLGEQQILLGDFGDYK